MEWWCEPNNKGKLSTVEKVEQKGGCKEAYIQPKKDFKKAFYVAK